MTVTLFIVLFALISCQNKPTQVVVTDTARSTSSFDAAILKLNPVIFDVRHPVDFGMSHIPGSIHTSWEDWCAPVAPKCLLPDASSFRRRLALWGVHPNRAVLIIGYGQRMQNQQKQNQRGNGEEGWLAFYLSTLGVKKIELGQIPPYRGQIPREGFKPENVPFWAGQEDTSQTISVSELRKRLAKINEPPLKIIDVRPVEERLARPLANLLSKAEFGVIRLFDMDWVNFFDAEMKPTKRVFQSAFSKLSWSENDEIYILSEDGVAAGGVTYALQTLGYNKTKNIIGGLNYWRSKK